MSRKHFENLFLIPCFLYFTVDDDLQASLMSTASFPGHILNNHKANRTKTTHLSASRAIKTHNGPMGLPTTTPTSYRSFRSFLENVCIFCVFMLCVPPVKIYNKNDCSAVKITFSSSKPRPKEPKRTRELKTYRLCNWKRGEGRGTVIIKRAATCDEDEQTMDTILGKQQFQIPPRLSTLFNGQKCKTRGLPRALLPSLPSLSLCPPPTQDRKIRWAPGIAIQMFTLFGGH